MNTDQTWQTTSTSSEATLKLAEQLGRRLKGGEIIEFISDLGGGKTCFVQGLAKGLGITEPITSPTFMIERVYNGRLELHHFDFYRLSDASVVSEELREVIGDQSTVVAIEWGDIIQGTLPDERIKVTINKTGDNSRDIIFNYPLSLAYALKELE